VHAVTLIVLSVLLYARLGGVPGRDTRELRFGVVCYDISLAIYMHGITKRAAHCAQRASPATAPPPCGPKTLLPGGRIPIRRFSDLICHRALLREIGQGDDPLPEDLSALAEHVSAREREVAEIEYLGDEICLAWLLER
jgi:hypothetical protein